ncbi:MAG: hypothetical protein ABIG42_08370 [bacterium]
MTFFILLQACHSMKNFPGLNATWYHNAIRRSVPMLFSLYSLIVTWFALFKSGNGDYINRTP